MARFDDATASCVAGRRWIGAEAGRNEHGRGGVDDGVR
jgi:hypothetical protein